MNIISSETILAINLQTATTCNGVCKLCNNNKEYKHNRRIMNDNIWYKLLAEINKLNYNLNIIFYFKYEPLTDPMIYKRINDLKLLSQHQTITIMSNGQLLNHDHREIYMVDEIYISILGGASGEHSYENITGWNLKNTINIIILNHLKGLPIKVSLSVADLDNIEIILDQFKKINIPVILNRIAGVTTNISSDKLKQIINDYKNVTISWNYSSDEKHILNIEDNYTNSISPICSIPRDLLTIDVDGNVLMCHLSILPVGNILTNSIDEIYNGSIMTKIKQNLQYQIEGHEECKKYCEFKFRGNNNV